MGKPRCILSRKSQVVEYTEVSADSLCIILFRRASVTFVRVCADDRNEGEKTLTQIGPTSCASTTNALD